jgi:hypothetical protein
MFVCVFCDSQHNTRWFKYDRDYLCVNKSQLVPVIFEPPCTYTNVMLLFPSLLFSVSNHGLNGANMLLKLCENIAVRFLDVIKIPVLSLLV